MWRLLRLTQKLIFPVLCFSTLLLLPNFEFSAAISPSITESESSNDAAAEILLQQPEKQSKEQEMGKRKSDAADNAAAAEEGVTTESSNPWAQCKVDEQGLVRELHIKEVDDLDEAEEDEVGRKGNDNKNNEATEEGGPATTGRRRQVIYQGPGWKPADQKLLPMLSGEPPSKITGFRSIMLHDMRNWDGGIDPGVRNFLQQISPLVAKNEKSEESKYCLSIALPYAFSGHQATNFGRNLAQFLSIPGIKESIGAFSYSEGGHLAELLARFPLLDPDASFLYRYDSHIYCENETLVEDYHADLEHWLSSQWSKPPNGSDVVRQARLQFYYAREDTALEMLDLIKENFNKAWNAYQDRRTFAIRIDCPGFSLEPFHIENTNTSEILALEYKDEVVINADNDVEDFVEEEPPEKRAARQKNGTAEEADDDEDAQSVVLWKSYKLVRASNGQELERLMPGQLPVLKRKIHIIH